MKTKQANRKPKAIKTSKIRRLKSQAEQISEFPTNLKCILVPTDFSPESEKALKAAEKLAVQFGAKITLVHVIEPLPAPDFGIYPPVLQMDVLSAQLKKKLDDLAANKLAPEAFETTVVLTGRPFREIIEFAAYLKSDLIVIATHGYTGLKHAFLGSTAERVVRQAPCPVLTIREKNTK